MPSEIIETILDEIPACPWVVALQVAINFLREDENK